MIQIFIIFGQLFEEHYFLENIKNFMKHLFVSNKKKFKKTLTYKAFAQRVHIQQIRVCYLRLWAAYTRLETRADAIVVVVGR